MSEQAKNKVQLGYISKLKPLQFADNRYVITYGGRGGAKSWAIAQMLVTRGYQKPLMILCTREIQNTIKDSVHKLICDTIERVGLQRFYTITKAEIKGANGTRFIFKGIMRNVNEIKSLEGIDICWIEEAHSISQDSLDVLVPTIRKEGSQIVMSFNPDEEDAPVQKMVQNPRSDSLVINVNYEDNKYFPNTLRKEMEYCRQNDYDKYRHIWMGETKKVTEACIFKGKFRVDTFETPKDVDLLFGADWGFSQDPTCLVRAFVKDNCIYIDYEAYGVGVELDEIGQLFNSIPESRNNKIIGDSARPDTISYLNRKGFIIKSSKKGAGSIEDGIEYLKSFREIVVHERCKNTIYEMKTYSYKKDRLTGEILPIIIDKNNHIIDSLRYAFEDMRKFRGEKQSVPNATITDALGWS